MTAPGRLKSPLADEAACGRITRNLQAHGLFEMVREAASRFHVTLAELLGRGRGKPETLARRQLWALAYRVVPSYTRLGSIFERDHSCIRAAVLKHQGKPSRVAACQVVPTHEPCGPLNRPAEIASCGAEAAGCATTETES